MSLLLLKPLSTRLSEISPRREPDGNLGNSNVRGDLVRNVTNWRNAGNRAAEAVIILFYAYVYPSDSTDPLLLMAIVEVHRYGKHNSLPL